jgi:hypothetical protein
VIKVLYYIQILLKGVKELGDCMDLIDLAKDRDTHGVWPPVTILNFGHSFVALKCHPRPTRSVPATLSDGRSVVLR